VLIELLCPLLIAVILIDCTSWDAWTRYEGRDPEIYAAVAGLWADGFMPYRDVYDFKPPLTYSVLRVGYALWGREAESFRRMLMILTALGALAMYGGLRRARCAVAAPIAALGLMTLVVANPRQAGFQSPEPFAAAFAAMALGFAAAHQRNARWWWAIATGAGLALATLGKQPAMFYALPLGLQLCLWGSTGNWWQRLRYVVGRGVLAGIGFGLIIGVTAIYFAWNGAWWDLIQAVIVDGGNYAGIQFAELRRPTIWLALAQRPTSRILLDYVGAGQLWPFLAAIIALVPLTLLRPSRWAAVTWAWLLAAFFASVVGPRQEVHYILISFPAQALTLGIVGEIVLGQASDQESKRLSGRLVGGLVIAFLVYGGIWRASYLPARHYHVLPGSDFGEQIGRHIRELARKGDTLLLEDQPFQIYAFAGLPPATRFIYYNAPHKGIDELRQHDVERRPTFIFLTHHTYELVRHHVMPPNVPAFPAFAQMMYNHYEECFAEPVGALYRRKDQAAPDAHGPADTGDCRSAK
jgi:4-amino-4-deoxy-L-arabinose transferase-like glycosyltransferase